MRLENIDLFYNTYKNSIGKINRAEKKLLKESYSYEKWQKVLRDKSALIRGLYTENLRLYDEVIKPVADFPENVTADMAEKLLFHIDFFISEGYRDYGVTVPVLNSLIPFYEKAKDRDRLFDCLFFKALSLLHHNQFDESEEIFNKAIAIYPFFEDCEAPYRKFRFMCAHYYRLLSLVNGQLPQEKKIIEYYETAIHLWCEVAPEGFLTPKKHAAIGSILRSIVAALGFIRLCNKMPIDKKIQAVIEEEFNLQAKTKGAKFVSSEVYVAYYGMGMATRRIKPKEYVERLLEKFYAVTDGGTAKFDYKFIDFISLFDDELPDEQFDRDYLLVVNSSFSFVHFVLTELLRNVKKNDVLKNQIFSLVYNYYAGFDYVSGENVLDLAIWDTLEKIIPFCDDKFAILTLIRNITVHRQITTAIHSLMVGKLTEAVAEYIYDKNPKFFGKALSKKSELTTFAREVGFCHDIGKLTCSDIVNLQSRKILNEEFALIKNHPEMGAKLLALNPISAEYVEVAMGHHKFFDGRGGYPSNFNNVKSKYKNLIDLVSICDSIDAATDYMGRNYAVAKDLPTVLGELQEMAGTRYNPEIVEMIASDMELQAIITGLIRKDRDMLQYELYRDYVMPDVHFTEADEKYIKPMDNTDFEMLSKIFDGGCVLDTMNEMCAIRCVLADSRGNAYCYLMAEKRKMDYYVHLIFTPINHRRKGYATILLDRICEMAKEQSGRRIYMQNRVEGHHDKFAWRRGFNLSSRYNGLMVLEMRKEPVAFITSCQTYPKDPENDFFGPCNVVRDNGYVELLAKYWPDDARVLMIAADPGNEDELARIRNNTKAAYKADGFDFYEDKIDAGDWNLLDKDEAFYLSYDVIFLCGGHVPTQNKFFEKIKLADKLRNYRGIVIGTSAGSMNMAKEVYAMPEYAEETSNPKYERFLPGLGLTNYMVIPHVQYLETIEIDGLNPITDIAVRDSQDREFIALEDGSFIFQSEGESEIRGKSYRIINGYIRR